MSTFSAQDHAFMSRALRVARQARRNPQPNPRVGCVLVNGGRVVGEGCHIATGEPHAEVVALRAAGDLAVGATAYVTLEPCAHQGRTPPCVEALLAARVSEVVAAMSDPFPQVSGRGFKALEAAGTRVRVGLMEEMARDLNRGFLSRLERARPFVTVKLAASLDGATAMTSGESQWITGTAARVDVQRLRAEHGVVMTGVDTIVADDPSLTVREEATGDRQPLRVVLDTHLRTPAGAKVLSIPGRTLIYSGSAAASDALLDSAATLKTAPLQDGRVSGSAVLKDLAQQGVNDVLVESGPTLAGQLLDDNVVDEVVFYFAPHIMGSDTRRLFGTPGWHALKDRRPVDIVDVRTIGNDIRITAVPRSRSE